MKRRTSLKHMGAVFGYIITAPMLLGILESCKRNQKEAFASWVPEYFDKERGHALACLIDVILPKTDTPSATEVGVHIFIDHFVMEVLPGPQLKFMDVTMDAFFNKVLSVSNKEALAYIEEDDILPLLGMYLKPLSDEMGKVHKQKVEEFNNVIEQDQQFDLDIDVGCHAFLENIRNLTIMAYRESEYVGEKILAYLPVPGEYISCVNTDELTQGKSWSL